MHSLKQILGKHISRLITGTLVVAVIIGLFQAYIWCWETYDWFMDVHAVIVGTLLCYAVGSVWDHIHRKRK